MKAAVHYKYGSPEVIKIRDIEKPVPADDELLIRVHAATVNRTDCAMLTAEPWFMRFMTGLTKPKKIISGTDFAGVVESAGNDVKLFKTGDKVFGFDDNGLSSHAEYMTFSENNALAVIPGNISFEQAAASIEGAHYAYNFLNKVNIKSGQKVLVNGASGAIGSAAVQLLKNTGAKITAVCNSKNTGLMTNLGAEKVIDYEKEDFTGSGEKFDFVFDTVGKSTFGKCKPVLNEGGIYISSELGPYAQNVFYSLFTPVMGNKKVKFPMPVNRHGSVLYIKKLLEEGMFSPVIDRTYTPDKTEEAFRYVMTGEKTGNVVIAI
ncbi:MAG TPA: NAD(P)-dependent alcohol dehydrogenase [Ignavibacteria bacterium]|nr:NAD(P)-dependent alcohol dehydrogenase [Ignavibacteria bacterium]HMR39503.1 NAD(P)-dependent alcohol dehydrogenase [Ignavibacteria bacterium]